MASAENQNRGNLSEKIVFFNKLGVLMKATSADNEPTSGYLLDEINSLSWQSGSLCSDLLDYMCARMDEKNYFVKQKTLLIMKHLTQNGHPDFRENLRKNSHILREATGYHSAPDPLLGNQPHSDIRRTAAELLELLFDEEVGSGEPRSSPERLVKPSPAISGGMGGNTLSPGKMQGFGNTIPKAKDKSLSGMLMEGLRDFAEKIQEDPGAAPVPFASDYSTGSYQPASSYQPAGGSYQPASMEADRQKLLAMQAMAQQPKERVREHRPGVAGGGWEDDPPRPADNLPRPADNPPRPADNLPRPAEPADNAPSSLKSSDDSTGLAERLASVSVNDWSLEQQILEEFIYSQSTPIPKRAEIDAFVERCGCANCDKLTELLNDNLNSDDDVVLVRSLVLLDYMLRCDVVSPDNLAWTCHQNLMAVFKHGQPQPQLKARKMIRQLERLSSNSYLFMDNLPTSHIQLTPSVSGC